MNAPILGSRWYCPNCDSTAVTYDSKIPMHPCRGLVGLVVALVRHGVRAKVEAVEREDYVGSEVVQTNGEGRPVMAVVTTTDEGRDCTVLAPIAVADARE